jgi:hypothetical protein
MDAGKRTSPKIIGNLTVEFDDCCEEVESQEYIVQVQTIGGGSMHHLEALMFQDVYAKTS